MLQVHWEFVQFNALWHIAITECRALNASRFESVSRQLSVWLALSLAGLSVPSKLKRLKRTSRSYLDHSLCMVKAYQRRSLTLSCWHKAADDVAVTTITCTHEYLADAATYCM